MIRIGKMKISLPMILFMYVLIYNPPLLAPLYHSNSVWLVMLPSIAYVLMHRKELKEFTNVRAVVCKIIEFKFCNQCSETCPNGDLLSFLEHVPPILQFHQERHAAVSVRGVST